MKINLVCLLTVCLTYLLKQEKYFWGGLSRAAQINSEAERKFFSIQKVATVCFGRIKFPPGAKLI